MTSAGAVGSTRVGVLGEMTRRLGEVRGRIATMVAALLLIATLLPGTNWTLAPLDPAFASGGYALISVGRGAAEAVADEARALGADDVASLDAIDVVSARVTSSALDGLRRDARVAFIASDAVVTAASDEKHFEKPKGKPSAGNEAIGARQAWGTATGRGVVVALMDTGIADHPDLAGSVVARVDFVNDGATSLDPGGHGTFLAGLVAAHGRTFSGVAPDAKLISLRVLDAQGRGTMHSVLAAFDWVLHNRAAYRVKVLNLSFGAPQTTTYHRTLLARVHERRRRARSASARDLHADRGKGRARGGRPAHRRDTDARPRRSRCTRRAAGACERRTHPFARPGDDAEGDRRARRERDDLGRDQLGKRELGERELECSELGGDRMGERVVGHRVVGRLRGGPMTGNGRINLYVGTVAAAGLVGLVASSRLESLREIDPLMLAVLVLLAVVAQRVPVFLFRSSAISVSFAAVIAAYVLYGTGAAVWVSLAQAVVNSVTPRRKPLRKMAFNFGSFAVSAYLAGEIYRLSGGSTPPTAIAPTLIGVGISAAAYFIVNTSLTAAAIAMSEAQSVLAVWRTND